MAKTRSQTQALTVKKEEDEKSKGSRLLRGLSNKTKKSSKINKRNASANDNALLSVSQVKLEEEEVTKKDLLRENKSRNNQTTAMELKDKLEKLFGYILNDKMSVQAAAKKATISTRTAYKYYKLYKNDPEQNIPVPVVNIRNINGSMTQEKIKKLIDYIDGEKMSRAAAARKLHISEATGCRYYRRYKNDPRQNIPVPVFNIGSTGGAITQEKIKKLIEYIDDEKMSKAVAARKLNISESTARRYYIRYKNDPERNIPVPLTNNTHYIASITQDKIKALIDYIEVEKMSVSAAAAKANIGITIAHKCYTMYKDDPERNIPALIEHIGKKGKAVTQDKIKKLIDYIEVEKVSIRTAARKANIGVSTAQKYYTLYKNNPERKTPVPTATAAPVTQENINKLIAYIVDDKMSIYSAAVKLNMCRATARHYYLKYLHNPDRSIPILKKDSNAMRKRVSQEQVKALIQYIVHDKMTIDIASLKSGMNVATARKYYARYLDDPNHQIPIPKKSNDTTITDSQINSLINYIVNDKLAIPDAARKLKIDLGSAYYYYNRYKTECKLPIPIRRCNTYTQQQVEKLVEYVESDNLSVRKAAKKVNMNYNSAWRYISKLQKKSKQTAHEQNASGKVIKEEEDS